MNETKNSNESTVEPEVQAPEYSPELTEAVNKAFGELTACSPYKLHQIINTLLPNGTKVQGPMMYGYVKSGRIPASKNAHGKHSVARKDAIEFTLAYVSKKLG